MAKSKRAVEITGKAGDEVAAVVVKLGIVWLQ
jgi:hypothetical protein